jgi:membrane protease YdiL (CAAX protease family)
MIDEIVSTVIQVVIFALIPVLVYLVTQRKIKGFPEYVGLKPSNQRANLMAVGISLLLVVPLVGLALVNRDYKLLFTDPNSVTGHIRLKSSEVEAIITIIIVAVFKTSFAEELFFRGFLTKRLIALTNFQVGNIIQAVIFGILHSVIFLPITDNLLHLLIIFLFPAMFAYLIGIVNERIAEGSILPGWLAHGLGNLLSYTAFVFFI